MTREGGRGGSDVSPDESRRTTSSTISRYISSYRIIMYYNTRPVRRPLMDLIDFRRVPESAGQTHYFSKDLSSPPLPPSSLSGTCSVAVRWQVDVAYPPREQDFGSRVGVPALSRGMEGTRQGESRSHPYFYCPSQVWFQGVKKVASFLFNPPWRGWTLHPRFGIFWAREKVYSIERWPNLWENRARIKSCSSSLSLLWIMEIYIYMGENLIYIIFHDRFNLTSWVGTVKIHRILFYRAIILTTSITGIPRAVNDLEP